jgi:hypothetical protein
MFFKENERVISFFFNQLGGGDVHKQFRGKGQNSVGIMASGSMKVA